MLYLDSSALVKLIVEESHSETLGARVVDEVLISSELALTEVRLAVKRARIDRRRAEQRRLRAEADQLLHGLAYVPVGRDLLIAAGETAPARQRTLDAIHVATALTIGEHLRAFVTYDVRQRDAAEAAGLPCESPGL